MYFKTQLAEKPFFLMDRFFNNFILVTPILRHADVINVRKAVLVVFHKTCGEIFLIWGAREKISLCCCVMVHGSYLFCTVMFNEQYMHGTFARCKTLNMRTASQRTGNRDGFT